MHGGACTRAGACYYAGNADSLPVDNGAAVTARQFIRPPADMALAMTSRGPYNSGAASRGMQLR